MIRDPEHRVNAAHLSRAALVYLRQSSDRQVQSNQESVRVQKGLRESAIALGWPHPELVDEDLGNSADGFAARSGFRLLLDRVTSNAAGIILCFDASRLSRNSKDWAQLFEFCGYFDTLIADQERVYDLSLPDHRFLLGILGSITEMENNLIQKRMRAGILAKAARGELRIPVPAGYVLDEENGIQMDPNRRVQSAIRQLFDQFDRLTSIRQVAMWYRDTGTRFPVKPDGWKAKILWQVPSVTTLRKLLIHPIYAGTYVWGRSTTRIDYVDGRLVKRVGSQRPLDQCQVCIPDHHPAYVTMDRIMANIARVAENSARWKMNDNQGAIREGLALLPGLLRCARCGSRIYVGYRKDNALYSCDGGHANGSRRCASFGAKEIDRRVSEELCRALEPLSVQAAIAAYEQSEEELTQELEGLRCAVESAQYEADRAFEQYDLVDPKNRLVADNLETRLNEKLAELEAAKERLVEAEKEERHLSQEQRRQLLDLARDFPEVWDHPEADPKLKKSLLRTAIREVLVECQEAENRLEVTIHWHGGVHTRIHVRKLDRRRGSGADQDLVEMVRKLAGDGITDAESARVLNMHGTTTPRGLPWTSARVANFRGSHHIRLSKRPSPEEYLTLKEAVAHLGVSHNGLRGLERIGALSRNQVMKFAPWRVERKQLDSDRVQALVKTLKANGKLPRGGCPEGQLSLLDDK